MHLVARVNGIIDTVSTSSLRIFRKVLSNETHLCYLILIKFKRNNINLLFVSIYLSFNSIKNLDFPGRNFVLQSNVLQVLLISYLFYSKIFKEETFGSLGILLMKHIFRFIFNVFFVEFLLK